MFEKVWLDFMIKNRKWDKKNGTWKYPKPNQYHMKVKDAWVKDENSGFNPEKGERGYWQNVFDGWEMGPDLRKHCLSCGAKLDELRNTSFPRIPRYAQKFCSRNCLVEFSKRKAIRKKRFGSLDTVLSWPTHDGKKIFRNEIKVSVKKNGKFEEFLYTTKKSKHTQN